MSYRLFFLLVTGILPLTAAPGAEKLLRQPSDWFAGAEGRAALEAILSWQTEHGDWPKNRDTSAKRHDGDRSQLRGTFDNGATTAEMRVLARAFNATGEARYATAFRKGLDHIFEAQYPNGGFPQYFPLRKGYYSHITFNDGCMVRLLELLQDVAVTSEFAFLDDSRRERAARALKKGIDCILNCQVRVNERLTVWCAQHDAHTLAPVKARSYELPSLSGGESGGILLFLMNLSDPSPRVVGAIEAGVAWFEESKIVGYRYARGEAGRALVKDPQAEPLWARFYEVETKRPFFCDRDGVKKYDLMEIGEERRRGYAWYTTAGSKVTRAYAKWLDR